MEQVATERTSTNRWELYRLLSEPVRLRLLALAAEEELAIGELAELLGEAQPNVSRHVASLRRAGLLVARRQGTRALVHLAARATDDAVVADAVSAGRALCKSDGSFRRIGDVVRARDAEAREFFDRPGGEEALGALPEEAPAYLTALGPLLARRRLAVDAGTGDGALLDVLAPLYERVVAIDRAEAQLARARARLRSRDYRNVELLRGEVDEARVRSRVHDLGGADAVVAARVLHHAPRPVDAMRGFAGLAAADGAVVVIEYVAHEDERLRKQQADLWLGFEPRELARLAEDAGLQGVTTTRIPAARCGRGPDGHLEWQALVARRPA